MPSIHCPGGHSFSDGGIPSPYGFLMISEEKEEPLVDSIMETIEQGDDVEAKISYLLPHHAVRAYKCPECGRLLLFENGLSEALTSYRPE